MNRQATLSNANTTTNNEQGIPGGIPLKIEDVSKVFPGRIQSVEALKPVNLEVEAGEFVCLLGPSGCGKSTLLSIIAGLESASTGVIWLTGKRCVAQALIACCFSRKRPFFPGWMCSV